MSRNSNKLFICGEIKKSIKFIRDLIDNNELLIENKYNASINEINSVLMIDAKDLGLKFNWNKKDYNSYADASYESYITDTLNDLKHYLTTFEEQLNVFEKIVSGAGSD